MSKFIHPVARAVAAGAIFGLVGAFATIGVAKADSSPILLAQATTGSTGMPVTPVNPPAATPAKPKSHVDRVEAHIAQLKAKLHITAAQEALWNDVAQNMRDNAKAVEDLTKKRIADAPNLTAVDDLTSFQEIAQAHADGLKKLTASFGALYAAMSDDQKKNADAVFRSFEHRPGPRHKAPAAPAMPPKAQ